MARHVLGDTCDVLSLLNKAWSKNDNLEIAYLYSFESEAANCNCMRYSTGCVVYFNINK